MQFVVDGKLIGQTLVKLQRIAGKDVQNLHLVVKDKHLYIHANEQHRRSMIVMDAVVIEEGECALAPATLDSICKNRGTIKFTLTDNKLKFNLLEGGSYKGEISTSTIVAQELLKLNKKPDISGMLKSNIINAIEACMIKSVFEETQLSLVIALNNKKLHVIAADDFHAAIVAIQLDKQELVLLKSLKNNIILPLSYAEILSKQFYKLDFGILAESNTVTFFNAEMMVELPTLQTNTVKLENIWQIDKDLKKKGFSINGRSLQIAMQNLQPMVSNGVPITIRFEQGSKSATIKTTSVEGSIQDKIEIDREAEKSLTLRLEPNNFTDLCRKLKEIVNISSNNYVARFVMSVEPIEIRYYCHLVEE